MTILQSRLQQLDFLGVKYLNHVWIYCIKIYVFAGMVLYLRHVSDMLALVCVLREEYYGKRALLDYNIDCLTDSLAKVLAVGHGQTL